MVQQVYIGTQDTAGAIDLVRTSGSSFAVAGSRARRSTTSHRTATDVTRSSRRSASARCCGPASSRRCARRSQGSQLVACDPAVAQRPGVPALRTAASRGSGRTRSRRRLVEHGDASVPDWRPLVRHRHDAGAVRHELVQRTRGAASSRRPAARRARRRLDDRRDARTATDIGTNKCQTGSSDRCNYDGNYDGTPRTGARTAGSSGRRLRTTRASSASSSSRTRRCKGVTGRGGRDPDARLRELLRHGLERLEQRQSDPCPDPDFERRRVQPSRKGTVSASSSRASSTSPARSTRTRSAPRTADPCRPTLVR